MNIEEKIERLKLIINEAHSLISDIKVSIDVFERDRNNLFNTPVSKLQFPKKNRFLGAIIGCDIVTIGDLLKHNPLEILGYHNMGKRTLAELRIALKEQFNIDW